MPEDEIAASQKAVQGQAGGGNSTIRMIAIEVLVNLVLPYGIYTKADGKISLAHALLAASLPPIGWSGIEFVRRRRLDSMSLLVVAGIVLWLLALLGGGSVRFLQLRENLVTGLIGVVFLGSAAVGQPLVYQFARARNLRRSRCEGERLARLQAESPQFRRNMMLMTLVWGFGLIAETLIACALVFALPIGEYLIAGPLLGYGAMGFLGLWTFFYVKRTKRRAQSICDERSC